jgi:hypothetical protein
MPTEPWELNENPSKYDDYNWWSDDVPQRKICQFLTEIGHRLRHLMTEGGPREMIGLCEGHAEGLVTDDEMEDAIYANRPSGTASNFAQDAADNLYFWFGDWYKVETRGLYPAAQAFAFLAAVEAKILAPDAEYDAVQAVREHPIFVAVYERTQLEWGALVRDIYGPNPFLPVPFPSEWRTDTAVTLARTMYDSRDFGAMPILADALQDAGCDNDDILAHCRDANQLHVRGCWVCDLVLRKK